MKNNKKYNYDDIKVGYYIKFITSNVLYEIIKINSNYIEMLEEDSSQPIIMDIDIIISWLNDNIIMISFKKINNFTKKNRLAQILKNL